MCFHLVLLNAQIVTGCQNPAFEWSLLNMRLWGRMPKEGMEQALISRKRLFTAVAWGRSSNSSQLFGNKSELHKLTSVAIRSAIAPPIRAYDKGGILINNPAEQFHWYEMSHTKSGCNLGAAAEVGAIGEQVASERSVRATCTTVTWWKED